MLTILIDARMYGLENAGIGRYIQNLIANLVVIDKKNLYYLLLREKYFSRLNFPATWKKVLADFPHYTIREQIYLPRLIGELNPDLVHFPNLNVSYFSKKPFVVTIHDLTMLRQKTNATTLPLPFYYAKRIPFRVISRKSAINSVKVIVPSNAVKKEVINYYKVDKNKVEVIYEGVSAFGDSANYPNSGMLKKYNIQKPYFLYVGNVYPHKNVQRLIEAVKSLNKDSKVKTQLLLVCARSVFLGRIEKYIREVNAKEHVKILGFVPDADLAALYKESVAFVFPSLSEGFGLPGLEAMSAGTLVLASEIPVFKEIYKDNALYFNPFDFSSIQKVMGEAVLFGRIKRERVIKKSQEFVKRYSWSKMAKETLNVYLGASLS